MSARIQTWFPFNVQVCLNGREWLGRQLAEAGIDFVRHPMQHFHSPDLMRFLGRKAHGIIRKVQKSHRYTLTPEGNQLTAALSAARNATLEQLLREAA